MSETQKPIVRRVFSIRWAPRRTFWLAILTLMSALLIANGGIANAITNGTTSDPNAFPFAVRISTDSKNGQRIEYCTGSLIRPNVVITDAHCVYQKASTSTVIFHYGYPNQYSRTAKQQLVNPGYSTNGWVNDVALLVLNKDASPGDTPVRMSNDLPSDGTALTTAGYGFTGLTAGLANQLQQMNTAVVPITNCPSVDPAIHFCTHSPTSTILGGDSGGPVMELVGGVPRLVGLTDTDEPLGNPQWDGVTSIAKEQCWIEPMLAAIEGEVPSPCMNQPRAAHTATLLNDGRVLVAGGVGETSANGYESGAELYDPKANTWATTGDLIAGRDGHTATLLNNGKVLIAGGDGLHGRIATAELYDPATGKWSTTGSMSTVRANHAAVLLANGKVLVTGGTGLHDRLATAELYDPATGTWSQTGSMTTARGSHTTTMLPNGKVLVTGGSGQFANGAVPFLVSADIYDPALGTWMATGSMITPRSLHTAVLANGKVLVAGGLNSEGILASAELYNPGTGTWSATAPMASARILHTATLMKGGTVLVVGGYGQAGNAISATQVYDPKKATWSNGNNVYPARAGHTATELKNGSVLVAGGLELVNHSGRPLAFSSIYK
ncbi:kelch repeat-containing protein [Arthrobacter sp. efr-133-TYG-118]|uniref:kelch repeat-containing protein n=1 Tax=Arthrobacter sp. efr-133-TYG-118 TaxID=3040279 RepID=UPI00254F5855|nr:kelch repeat-containing protein [Arthrobacter sp. efr-133-TYG-118]